MDCRLCRQRDASGITRTAKALRVAWGCDKEATQKRSVLCPHCHGANCERCDFTGEIDFKRCPNAVAVPKVHHAMRACNMAREHGVLPVAGGMQAQAAAFAQALAIVDSEVGAIRREHEARDQ